MNQTSTSRLLRKSVATLIPLFALTAPLSAAVVYWDRNGVTPGAGPVADGTWDDAGLNWNADPGGEGAGPAAWSSGDTAVFSAGTDAVGAYTVNISGNKTVTGMTVEDGIVTFTGNAVVIGTSTLSVTNGATMSINTSTQISATAGGKVLLDGGTLRQTNPGQAGSFIPATATLEIGPAGGTVNYTSSGAGTVSIYTGTITGVGGTLTKAGPHEFRYQGTGLPNTTYSKLVVKEGLFRLGFANATQDERGFGAVPATFTPDAITLDGGSIGTSFNATLNANRGVTLGIAGGTFNTSGGGMTVPGAITGPGGLTKLGTSMASPLTLSGANTYLGVTTVNQGIVQFARQVALYNNTSAAWTDANIIVASGAALGLNVGGTGEFTVADVDLLKGLGSATGGFANGSFLSLDTTNAGGTFTYNSVIANTNGGANVLGLSKTGTGTLVLGGANAYTGTTTVRGGTLTLSATGSIADTAPLTIVGTTAIFDLGANRNEIVGTVTLQTSGRINGTGTSTLIVGAGTFEMQSGTVNANLAGSAAMNKTTTGTVTIAGSSIHTGETLITGGTLHITGSLNGTSNVSVASTVTPTPIPGVLSGSGSINVAAGGDITLFPGGKLAPGTATTATVTGTVGTLSLNPVTPAIVNISGGVDAIGSQALVFELDTVAASDRVTLGTGGLVIGAGLLELDDFLFTPLAGFSSGGIRDFVLFDGSLPISGSLGPNVTGTLGGFDVTLQLGDGGNDLILHVVPEPGSVALLIGGLAVLTRRRRHVS